MPKSKVSSNGHLKPDLHNARKHGDRNKALIRASLQEVGGFRSIAVDGTDTIRAGNGVYEQAKALGMTVRIIDAAPDELIAVRRKDLTGKKAERAALLDNRSGELSEWDDAVIAEIAQNERELLDGMFSDKELRELLGNKVMNGDAPDAQIDKAAELQAKWQVQRGDVWQIGRHRLMCGDSTSKDDVARLMDGRKVDGMVLDPPYGVGVDYGEFQDTPENVKALIDGFMPIVMSHLPAAITPGVPAMWDYPRPDWVGVWVHSASTSSGPWGFVGANPILYYGKDPYLAKGMGRRDSSQVMVTTRKGEDEHPVSKPLALWSWLVQRIAPEPDLAVLDLFNGSGTTLVACEQLGRIGYGMEIEPKYVSVTLERLQAMGLTPVRCS